MIEWIKFKDLKFEKHFVLTDIEEKLTSSELAVNPQLSELCERYKNDIQCRISFDNGFSVSIIKGQFSHGGNEDLYELAVLSDDGIQYNTAITQDVLGYLSEEEVEQIVYSIQCLEDYNPDKEFHDFINGDAKLYWKMTGNDQQY